MMAIGLRSLHGDCLPPGLFHVFPYVFPKVRRPAVPPPRPARIGWRISVTKQVSVMKQQEAT